MAMNWVEEEYRREQSLQAHADGLVEALFLAIKESVDSFNRLYRQGKPPVDQHPNKHHLVLTLALPVPPTLGLQRSKTAKATISYDAESYKVHTKFEQSNAQPVVLELDANDSGEVFLHGMEGKSRIETGAASRLILKTFLWDLRHV